MAVSEKDLLVLKRAIEDKKNQYISAKATMDEVNRNIEEKNNELKELGIDPLKVDEYIEKKGKEIEEMYNNITERLS